VCQSPCKRQVPSDMGGGLGVFFVKTCSLDSSGQEGSNLNGAKTLARKSEPKP